MSALDPNVDLCTLPAGELPPGQSLDLENPPSLAPATLGFCITSIILTTFFTSTRLWINRNKLRWSDWFTLAAFILHTAYTGIVIHLRRYGRHQWDVPLCWINGQFAQMLYAQLLISGAALFTSKVAIFLLYKEVFGVTRNMRIAIYAGIIVSGLLYSTFLPIMSIYQAPAAGESWDEMLARAASFEDPVPLQWNVAIGIGSIILDIYIIVLPLPTIIKLHMSTSKRLQLAAVFGVGFLGLVASIIATVYRVILLNDTSDGLWNQGAVTIARLVENGIAIIVGSAPAFSNFLIRYVGPSKMWAYVRSNLRSTFSPSTSGLDGGNGSSKKDAARAGLWTIGSQGRRQHSSNLNGFELNDPRGLGTETGRYDMLDDEQAVGGLGGAQATRENKDAIREMEPVQQISASKQPGSTERLVWR